MDEVPAGAHARDEDAALVLAHGKSAARAREHHTAHLVPGKPVMRPRADAPWRLLPPWREEYQPRSI
mgnify:CR=1 FL=1